MKKRLLAHQVWIMALDPERNKFIKLPAKSDALAKLRKKTGQDFGDNAEQWRRWFKMHPKG